jgi:hypothetical protein
MSYEWPSWKSVLEEARGGSLASFPRWSSNVCRDEPLSVESLEKAYDAMTVPPTASADVEMKPRYRYREALVYTPKKDHRAFTPPLVAGVPVPGRFQCRVGKTVWVNLVEYGGRHAFAVVVADEDEVQRAEDAAPIVELGTIVSVGHRHLEVTGVHSDEAMAVLHEELTGEDYQDPALHEAAHRKLLETGDDDGQ